MKKILSILLVLCLALAFVACGTDNSKANTNNSGVIEGVEKGTRDTIDGTKDMVEDGADAVRDAADDTGDAVRDAVDDTGDAGKDMSDDLNKNRANAKGAN